MHIHIHTYTHTYIQIATALFKDPKKRFASVKSKPAGASTASVKSATTPTKSSKGAKSAPEPQILAGDGIASFITSLDTLSKKNEGVITFRKTVVCMYVCVYVGFRKDVCMYVCVCICMWVKRMRA